MTNLLTDDEMNDRFWSGFEIVNYNLTSTAGIPQLSLIRGDGVGAIRFLLASD